MTTTRSTPILQRIERILLEQNGSPITLLELHRLLRRQGVSQPLDRLRAILADQRVFTELPGDRFVLRDQFVAPVEEDAQLPEQPVFLRHMRAANGSYLVLDIETSGLDPKHDQIIQLSILQVNNGRPQRFMEWFFQCDLTQLPNALRRTLHLDTAKLDRIAAAPSLDSLLPTIRTVLADHPLVIHNARFDMGFLREVLPELTNPVIDTMELALLLIPHAPNHKLATLAAQLGIALHDISCPAIDGLPAGHIVDETTLHDATTDVLLLDAVYRALMNRWQLMPVQYIGLFESLIPEAFLTNSKPTTDLAPLFTEPTEQVNNDYVVQDVDSLALLDRVLAQRGAAVRPSQRRMVELIAEALSTDTSRLIEAPTGTGKTLGYLIPAIWAAQREGRRIAIATAVKNLQDQVRDELARLQEVIPIRAQVLKGASSYLCLRNLQQAMNDATSASLERRFLLAFLAHWATKAAEEFPTLDELPFWLRETFPETEHLAREVAVDRLDCTERRCPFFNQCHLFGAYRRAEQSDILLLNHSLWLSEPHAMPPFDALMIDEAHNLEDRATAAYQQEVSEVLLRALLYRLAVPGTRRGALQRVLDLQPDETVRQLVYQARHAIGQALALIKELRATLAEFVVGCDERLRPEQGAQLRLVGRPDRV